MSFESKLRDLSVAINTKVGKAGKKTIAQLTEEVNTLTKPTGTIDITSNGTVDVSNYASANVNVSGGLITKNNITSFANLSSLSFASSVYSIYTTTTWSKSPGTGVAGSYWYVLGTIPNVERVIIPSMGGDIAVNTHYCIGYHTFKTATNSTYTRAVYIYYDQATATVYLLYNTNSSSTGTQYLIYYNHTSLCMPYMLQDIIIQTASALTFQQSQLYYYGSASCAASYFLKTGTTKTKVIFSNMDLSKTYTLIRGFYFNSYGTSGMNLIKSELEASS